MILCAAEAQGNPIAGIILLGLLLLLVLAIGAAIKK